MNDDNSEGKYVTSSKVNDKFQKMYNKLPEFKAKGMFFMRDLVMHPAHVLFRVS